MNRPRVLVVGCGFGGLAAVRALSRAPVEITLIDRTNHHLFQPLLYQVAAAVEWAWAHWTFERNARVVAEPPAAPLMPSRLLAEAPSAVAAADAPPSRPS